MTVLPTWLLAVFSFFAGIGLVCVLVPVGVFFWLLWEIRKEHQQEQASLHALKKQLSSIDSAYR